MTDAVHVFLNGRLAGCASRREGSYEIFFRYDGDYCEASDNPPPLSLRMPRQEKEYPATRWLEGLLPDNPEAREQWAVKYASGHSDTLSLLGSPIGLDCAGAVQFCEVGQEDSICTRESGVVWHSPELIADWAHRAKRGALPLLAENPTHSLAGWQAKAGVHREAGNWGTPYGDLPTTWILKIGIGEVGAKRRWANSELIEHVTMAAARHMGCNVPQTEIHHFAGQRVVAVQRYDREEVDGKWRRIHQEDFCQLLDVLPVSKYERHGGPDPFTISRFLQSEAQDGAAASKQFLDGLLLNWLFGGTDGHAKNYSLLLLADRVNMCAPLYDLMSEFPYIDCSPSEVQTAMNIGAGYAIGGTDHPSVWANAAHRFGVDTRHVLRRAEYLVNNCVSAVEAVINDLEPGDQDCPEVGVLLDITKVRKSTLQERFRHASQKSWPVSPQITPAVSFVRTATGTQEPPESSRSGIPNELPISTNPIVCGYPTGLAEICQRLLTDKPCPEHNDSSGSDKIRSRNKALQEAQQAPRTGWRNIWSQVFSSRGNIKEEPQAPARRTLPPTIIPSGLCGAATKSGGRCRHPAPPPGGRCSAGHSG